MFISIKILFLISFAVMISLIVFFSIGFACGWAFDINKKGYLDGWDDAGKAFMRDMAESKKRSKYPYRVKFWGGRQNVVAGAR